MYRDIHIQEFQDIYIYIYNYVYLFLFICVFTCIQAHMKSQAYGKGPFAQKASEVQRVQREEHRGFAVAGSAQRKQRRLSVDDGKIARKPQENDRKFGQPWENFRIHRKMELYSLVK